MKIIDFIKGLFKKPDYKEKLKSFIASNPNIDISYIIAREIDTVVEDAIENKLTGFGLGLDYDIINTKVSTNVYNKVLSELSKSDLPEKEKRKLNLELSMEFIENYIFENTPIDNDKIIESFQRFIDANMERVKKEDEEAAKALKDQYENVDTLPEAEYIKASEYDDPYFNVYGEEKEEIIPPVDEESDVIEDDGSIEILNYPDYEAENEGDEE